jgi:hypothetical protein
LQTRASPLLPSFRQVNWDAPEGISGPGLPSTFGRFCHYGGDL